MRGIYTKTPLFISLCSQWDQDFVITIPVHSVNNTTR